MGPLLVMIGASMANAAGTIIAEALVDTTTDFVMDQTNDVLQDLMPNFSDNQYVKQFTNQVRMGAATYSNARVMTAAIKSQNRLEEKLEAKRQASKQKYEVEKQRIAGMTSSKFNKSAKGKRLENLERQYKEEINGLEKDVGRAYVMRQSAATEAGTFSGGTGAIKRGHDGTLASLRPSNNNDLVSSIDDLLNGMGYYPQKAVAT